jgi:hypothetical protein
MNKKSASEKNKECVKGWCPILDDAKVALAEAKQRVKRLKKTIANIEGEG